MRRLLPALPLLLLALGDCTPGPGETRAGDALFVVSNRGGAWRVYEVQRSDGTARLIGSPDASDPAYQDSMPALLPDGRVAFVSNRGGHREIYLADRSGRGAVPLIRDPSPPGRGTDDSDPAPLGRDRIVFARTEPGGTPGAPRDLYVCSLDGSAPRRLTRSPADDSAPAGSPDGREVAFVSDRSGAPRIHLLPDVDAADPEAGIVDLSGAAPTESGSPFAGRPFVDAAPAYLPDGSVVFSRRPEGGAPHLFQIRGRARGESVGERPRLRQITDGITLPYGADEPVVLGDADLLFVTGGPPPQAGSRRKASRYAVYRIALGGFNLSRVTREEARYDDFSRRLEARP